MVEREMVKSQTVERENHVFVRNRQQKTINQCRRTLSRRAHGRLSLMEFNGQITNGQEFNGQIIAGHCLVERMSSKHEVHAMRPFLLLSLPPFIDIIEIISFLLTINIIVIFMIMVVGVVVVVVVVVMVMMMLVVMMIMIMIMIMMMMMMMMVIR